MERSPLSDDEYGRTVRALMGYGARDDRTRRLSAARVAEAAGVSRGTVERVLQGEPTRERDHVGDVVLGLTGLPSEHLTRGLQERPLADIIRDVARRLDET